MSDISILTMDGHNYRRLDILEYEVGLEILDGEGTGRTRANTWPMIRDPQGFLINLYLEIGATSNECPEYRRLWQLAKSFGSRDFAPVTFRDPVGDTISQNMYIVLGKLKAKKFEKNGKVYSHSFKLSLIAQRGN